MTLSGLEVIFMVRTKSYNKNIVCLESFWTYDVENRLSVSPLLEILSKKDGSRSVTLTCNIIDELKFNLGIARKAKRAGFCILYLAFHGYPGGIYLPDMKIDIESLAEFMGKGFRDWIVFFDSCSTLRIEKGRVLGFMEKTGVSTVIGYRKDMDWLEGAAVDLLVLNWLQYYKELPRFWSRFKRVYRELVKITGLEVWQSGRR